MSAKLLTAIVFLRTSLTYSQVHEKWPASDSTRTLSQSYGVGSAFEAESLFSMFFTGGYHFCLAYRYEQFRVRLSVINGGTYDAEPAGVSNAKDEFKRFYRPSPGVFLGYNVWKGLELYMFVEGHTFRIEQQSSGLSRDVKSIDVGGGASYQFFIGRVFYIQPGLHAYFRERKELQFSDRTYRLPGLDIAPVIRIGVRLWECP
jgi:hypothetical protein